jgi:hypothetical protein
MAKPKEWRKRALREESLMVGTITAQNRNDIIIGTGPEMDPRGTG